MARKYHEAKRRKVKNEIRNELFNILLPYQKAWVRAILSKYSRYESDEEILSLSWNCFLFSLDRFDMGKIIRFPQHFCTYSEYYLRNEYKKEAKDQEIIIVDEHAVNVLKNSSACEQPVGEEARGLLKALSDFHESLPDEYKVVFEDALSSINGDPKSKLRRIEKSKLPRHRYNEAKRVFTFFVIHMREIH